MWCCMRVWAAVLPACAGAVVVAMLAGCAFDTSGLAPGSGDGVVDASRAPADATLGTNPDAGAEPRPDASLSPPPDAGPALPPDAGIPGPVRDLVCYWPLDEITDGITPDLAQHGLHGTVSGATLTDGRRGGALRFDGDGDAVLIGNPPELSFSGAITVAAWIRPRAFSGFRNVVAHGYTLGPDAEVFLRIFDGRYEGGSYDGQDHRADVGARQGDDDRWIHLTIVYDGATWRLYRDGEQVDVTTDATGAVQVNEGWAIGARGNGMERFFEGDIDEVRIYRRALSADEVAELAAL